MNILQKLKDGANRATEKAQHVVEINKLNGQISEIEQQKGTYYLQMGKVFYEGYRSKDMSVAEKEMVELAKTCDGLQEQIDSIRNRIAVLKNERLCQCGRVVALDAVFCPYCGNKLGGLAQAEESAAQELNVKESKTTNEREYFYGEFQDEKREDTEEYEYQSERSAYNPEAEYEPESAYAYEREHEEMDVRESITTDTEQQLEQEDPEKERRHWEDLERERERQLELDRRIRFWQENNQSPDYASDDEEPPRDMVKCQICSVDLPKGSKWCPRCGAEQI
ncbi:hypothetical protein JCM10914A_25820 [Paenibacillus sp. JCM 10914]|uniref:zinc ribbon domain-containing protein n=1 Tax=Paenibacillus sp. JCM 10914 TaxID=1236974 RepID=UPI0003CC4713|nr:zinc ribbon domain-containing protein [Paenibacillus sp. JCM 10914]GAE07647.1 hypothetical protein JCM10914_3887 [Paenibacillus sp. JCM 10914]